MIIIIYHDFLPPQRRGSHVTSDNTHTIVNIRPIAHILDICALVFRSCPLLTSSKQYRRHTDCTLKNNIIMMCLNRFPPLRKGKLYQFYSYYTFSNYQFVLWANLYDFEVQTSIPSLLTPTHSSPCTCLSLQPYVSGNIKYTCMEIKQIN